jgi:poly(A) polymerase
MGDSRFEQAVQIVRMLQSQGYETYLAGGCVRDHLLGVAARDYDIATSALPQLVLPSAARSFGVLKVADGVDVAPFRVEGPYKDGRHPEWFKMATPREDALRRDFTVNGMFWDPVRNTILDYVGGQEDLRQRVLRTVGDPLKRFEEDKLRMLRAVRFETQLGFSVDVRMVDAIRALAPKILEISNERVLAELLKILAGPFRSSGLRHLQEWGLLEALAPQVAAMVGVPQPPESHPEGDVWVHTLLALDRLQNPDPILALALLLHDIGKPPTFSKLGRRIRFVGHDRKGEKMARDLCRRLGLSHADTERVAYLVGNHTKLREVRQMRPSTLKRFLSHPDFEDLKVLGRADILASDADLTPLEFVEQVQRATSAKELHPVPLLTGKDLLALGLAPGPAFKTILEQLEELQLEGVLSTREQALEHVKKNFLGTP